jgi:hypothetical protein
LRSVTGTNVKLHGGCLIVGLPLSLIPVIPLLLRAIDEEAVGVFALVSFDAKLFANGTVRAHLRQEGSTILRATVISSEDIQPQLPCRVVRVWFNDREDPQIFFAIIGLATCDLFEYKPECNSPQPARESLSCFIGLSHCRSARHSFAPRTSVVAPFRF